MRPMKSFALTSGSLIAIWGAACSPAATGRADSNSAEHVVRYLTSVEETSELEASAKEAIRKFEEDNPHIDVRREAVNADDLRAIIGTRLRSSRPPDLFGYDTGPGFAGVLAKANLLYPLDKAYEKYGWPVYDWAKQRVTYGGVVFGVPGNVQELGVYYNKDIFDELGIGEPTKVHQLEAIAEAVKADGLIPFGFGNEEKWPAGHLFSMAASNLLGPAGLDEALYGTAKWSRRKIVRAIDLVFDRFVERGFYPPAVNEIPYADGNTLFYAGKAAMTPTGTWLIGELEDQDVGFRVGFFPFPSIDSSGISPPAGVGDGLFVARNTAEPRATLKLLNYLAFSEGQVRAGLERFNEIPAFSTRTSRVELSPLFESVVHDFDRPNNRRSFGYNIDVLTPQRFNTVMGEGFQAVLSGNRTPQQQARALEKAYEEARAAGETLEAS